MASRSAQPIDEEAGAEAGLIWDKKERVDGDRRRFCHRQTTSPCLRGRREQLQGNLLWLGRELGQRLGVKGRRPLQ